MSEALKRYRKEAKQAAIDLRYGEEIINAIRKAKSESEICNIMVSARRTKLK